MFFFKIITSGLPSVNVTFDARLSASARCRYIKLLLSRNSLFYCFQSGRKVERMAEMERVHEIVWQRYKNTNAGMRQSTTSSRRQAVFGIQRRDTFL